MVATPEISPARPGTSESVECEFCGVEHHESLLHCPHCGRPQNFPNVVRFGRKPHTSALHERYEAARTGLIGRGLNNEAATLQSIAEQSRAVISRPFNLAYQLVRSDDAGYATFYDLHRAGVRLPAYDRFTRLRVLADHELFATTYVDAIRFAALSPDGRGLKNYGEVVLELAEHMIAHRSTVFVANSAVFFEKARSAGQEPVKLEGLCAVWADRWKLVIAKCAGELTSGMDEERVMALLLRNAEDSHDDEFLEVHICGSLSRRSLARVLFPKDAQYTTASLLQDLREQLQKADVELELS